MILRRIDAMDVIPRGYGVAWQCSGFMGHMIAPIPLNILLHWLHATWRFLIYSDVWWIEGRMEKALRKAWRSGRRVGNEQGELRGYEAGYAKGREDGAVFALRCVTRVRDKT